MSEIDDYVKTDWVDEETPLDAYNLNKIEQGIYDNRNYIKDLDSLTARYDEDEEMLVFGAKESE